MIALDWKFKMRPPTRYYFLPIFVLSSTLLGNRDKLSSLDNRMFTTKW